MFSASSTEGSAEAARIRFYISAAWLAFILHAALLRIIRAFPAPGAEINSDARWTYLPNAQKLLAQPWSFLTTDPSSYHVAPLSYAWVALWGANPILTQLANSALFFFCILLMWRSATRLGGLWSGVVSTALLVYVPGLSTYIPQVLTESLYLFGLMLFITSIVEYVLNERWRSLWLAIAALGLTITLLSRPVLQILVILSLVMAVIFTVCLKTMLQHRRPSAARWYRVINPSLCIALLAALALPAATIIKNGVYFDLWGMGTGAGSGLYYGLSPFKMGLEPVYSGFRYDAGAIPMAAAPQTRGNPLTAEADSINMRVAIELVKKTSLHDNFFFFAQKLFAWLFYSTPELKISPKLRIFRIFEWLIILMAGLALIWRHRTQGAAIGKNRRTPLRLPGTAGGEAEKLALLVFFLLAAMAMAAQLTPVLYNTRYNLFFIEPWLMVLCGCGTAILLQVPRCRSRGNATATPSKSLLCSRTGSSKLGLVAIAALVPLAIGRYAQRHETWSMDPYRPGPTEVALDVHALGEVVVRGGTVLTMNTWRLSASTATLVLPITPASPAALLPNHLMDAIWRIRLSVDSPGGTRACSKALLHLTNAHPPQDWYEPEHAVNLVLDGKMHTYAFSGNGPLRPAGRGELTLTLSCPLGTMVTWGGAELLKSTTPEAARDFILNGVPIDPYRRSDPSPASAQ